MTLLHTHDGNQFGQQYIVIMFSFLPTGLWVINALSIRCSATSHSFPLTANLLSYRTGLRYLMYEYLMYGDDPLSRWCPGYPLDSWCPYDTQPIGRDLAWCGWTFRGVARMTPEMQPPNLFHLKSDYYSPPFPAFHHSSLPLSFSIFLSASRRFVHTSHS